MSKLDISRASRETLERLSMAFEHHFSGTTEEPYPEAPESWNNCITALAFLRSECSVPAPTLRTRAEVDAEIVLIVRQWPLVRPPVSMAQHLDAFCGRLDALVSEPVAEPPADECPSCQSQDKDLRLVEADVPCADQWHDPVGEAPEAEPFLHRVAELVGMVNHAEGQGGVEYPSEHSLLRELDLHLCAYRREMDRIANSPIDDEFPEPEPCKDPCGCPASDELRERVASLETELSVTRGGHRYWRQKASAIPVDREEFDRVKVATRTLIRCMRELRQTPGAFVASQLATIEEALR